MSEGLLLKKSTLDAGGHRGTEQVHSVGNAAKVSTAAELPGTWSGQTYDDVSLASVTSKELDAGVIALRATYYGIAASTGVAMGIAIDAANAAAGESAIEAGTTPQIVDGTTSEWLFTSSATVTRVDFQSMVAETGTSKFLLEWKVAS